MKFDRPFFSIIIFAFCLIFPAISFGQVNRTERIISYNSDININQDGSMIVTETITVHSEGINIKRGIYRDFPTDYKDNYGNNIKVDFDLLETLRDGNTEDYHTENLSNGIRVYLGNKNVYLRPGNYTYKIVYKTNRQLGFFGDHDELYWNVTGNGWDFPIEKASAVVSLPEGIASSQIKCYGYTGLQGSRASNLKCSVIGPGKVRYFTTEPLRPRQGLTIVAEFPKGFVAEPTKAEKMGYFIKDNSGIIIGLIGVIVVFLYYFFIWLKVGKDPEKGTIIPLFTPPSKFSPSAMRYVKKMGFDNKNFAAAIINMAVKGYLKIEEIDGDYTLIRKNSDLTNLTTEEKKIASSLTFSKNGSAGFNEEQAEEIQKKLNTFGNKNFFFKKITGAINSSLQQKLNQNKNKTADDGIYKLELKQSNHTIIKSGIDALKKSLKNSYEKNYFLTNRKYFVIGLIISLLFLVASTLLSSAVQTGLLIWVSVWSVGVFALLFTAFKSWRDVFKGGKIKFAGLGGAIFITLFAIPFVFGEIFGLYMFSKGGNPFIVVILICIAVMNIVFYHLLKAPTLLGRKLLDKIDGFKMYLSVAEKDRLNILNPPDKTPELFEKYLPYAFALDVEQEWSEQFASVLSAAGAAGQTYTPLWYSGSNWSSFNPGGFASSFSNSFSSAVSSSSTAPGSSSGSGGSSGGGGGGGGGGGW